MRTRYLCLGVVVLAGLAALALKATALGDVQRQRPPAANPRVAPGKVRWHDDFAAACAADAKADKPVLLFQMLGRLDEQFC